MEMEYTNHIQREMFNSEDIYRIIFENSAVAIMVTDEQERIIQWNQYTEELLGYNHDDLHMRSVSALYPPEEWQNIRAQDIRKKGMQHHLETKMIMKNQETIDIDISVSVLKDHQGGIIGSIGVIKDISKRKQAEAKVVFEHGLLQDLLETIPDSIYFKDKEHRFILVSKAKAEHSHTTVDAMRGKTDFDFLPEDQARKAFADDSHVMETGQPIINKIEHLTRDDGSDCWVSVTKVPRRNEHGEITGTMGISRDVTAERKELRETEKYKKVAVGQNLRLIELRDKVKDLIAELDN